MPGLPRKGMDETMYEQIKLLGGAVVTADLSGSSNCKRCRRTIWWAITKNAKKMPICKNDKGEFISHFADCPGAKEFRKDDNLDGIDRQKERDLWGRDERNR